jgi:hypothetical protein
MQEGRQTNLESVRLSMGLLQKPRQMDVEESGDVPKIEKANVAEVDRLLHEHRMRDHASGDAVPSGPEVLPVVRRGYTEGRRGIRFSQDQLAGAAASPKR